MDAPGANHPAIQYKGVRFNFRVNEPDPFSHTFPILVMRRSKNEPDPIFCSSGLNDSEPGTTFSFPRTVPAIPLVAAFYFSKLLRKDVVDIPKRLICGIESHRTPSDIRVVIVCFAPDDQ